MYFLPGTSSSKDDGEAIIGAMSSSTATFLREEEEIDLVLVAFSAPFPIFGLCGFLSFRNRTVWWSDDDRKLKKKRTSEIQKCKKS